MEWERRTNDQIEQLLDQVERRISQGRALQMEALEELDRRQVFNADGCRSLSEWTAARLDVSNQTARTLVRTMRRTQAIQHLREALANGDVTFDRAEALSRLDDETELFEHLDISGVRRMAADRVGITPQDEADLARKQFLVMEPSLDQSWWKLWGGLDGVTGAVVDRALSEKADQLPEFPDGANGPSSWRRAMALYDLASGGESPKAQVTVFVDAAQTVPSNGRAGLRLDAGPRVGVRALEAIFCDSVCEVIVAAEDGTPMRYGHSSQPTPPALRRAVLATTGGYCSIDGCNSRYRVEVHHKVPRSQGGSNDRENLTALCWFHHHIAIHQHGFQIFEHEAGRIRLRNQVPPCKQGKRNWPDEDLGGDHQSPRKISGPHSKANKAGKTDRRQRRHVL